MGRKKLDDRPVILNLKIRTSQKESIQKYADKYHKGNVSQAVKSKLKKLLSYSGD